MSTSSNFITTSSYYAQKFYKLLAESTYDRKSNAVINSSPYYAVVQAQAKKLKCTPFEFCRAAYWLGRSGCVYITCLWFIDYKLFGYSVGSVRHHNLLNVVKHYFEDCAAGLIKYDCTVYSFKKFFSAYSCDVSGNYTNKRPETIHIEKWKNGSIVHFGVFKGNSCIYDPLEHSRTFEKGSFYRTLL